MLFEICLKFVYFFFFSYTNMNTRSNRNSRSTNRTVSMGTSAKSKTKSYSSTNYKTNNNNTANTANSAGSILRAIEKKDYKKLEMLVKKAKKTDLRKERSIGSFTGRYVDYAAKKGLTKMTDLLMKHTNQRDKVSVRHFTPLMYAVKNDDVKMIEMLVKNHKERIALDGTFYGESVLDIALEAKKDSTSPALELLLKSGAKPNKNPTGNMTPLQYTILSERTPDVMLSQIQTLLKYGADPKQKFVNPETHEEESSLHLLIEAEIETQALNRNNGSHETKLRDTIKMMISKGVSINSKSYLGVTPLVKAMYAPKGLTNTHVKLLEILLSLGAKTTHRDKNGKTVLQVFDEKIKAEKPNNNKETVYSKIRRLLQNSA